jgi:hypothetical protein
MQRRAVRLAAFLPALALSVIAATGARADDVGRDEAARVRRSLVSLTPPVAGYSSFQGVIYNAAPLSYEHAVFSRGGLRLSSSVVAYDDAVQGYGLILGVPLYLGASAPGRPYGGLYAAPLVAALVDRLPRTRSTLRPGAEVGYAWTFAQRWRFSVGLWSVFKPAGFDSSAGGLVLALGMWL